MAEAAGAASVQLSDFAPEHLISDQQDARIYQVRHPRTGELLALKVWRRASHLLTAQQRAEFTEQVSWLTEVSRDTGRIIRCHEAGLDGFPWVATELSERSLTKTGDTSDEMGVELARDAADALLTVLRRLLRDGKAHGRLSRSDLLVVRGRVVLGVFGMLPDPGSGRAAVPGHENDLATIAAVVLDLLPSQVPPHVRQVLADVALRAPGAPVEEDIAAIQTVLGLDPEGRRPPEPTPEPSARRLSAVEQVRMPRTDRSGLAVAVAGEEHLLSPGTEAVIGRAPTAQIRVLDSLVSRRHARIHDTEDGWRITDVGSSNGVWRDGVRISHATVGPAPLRVRVGSPKGPEVVLTRRPSSEAPSPAVVSRTESSPPAESSLPVEGTTILEAIPGSRPLPVTVGRAPKRYDIPSGSLVIGRGPECGIVFEDLLISRRHAELRRSEDRITVLDLNSANGTFVNGERTHRRDLIAGDLLGLGGVTLRFEGTGLIEVDDTDGVEFGAHGLSLLVDGTRLLSDVSFRLPPRSLLAVVGPSGVGKSTLLNTLAGLRPATAGQVLYGGRDVYRSYDELRHRIGYLPRRDILHPELTLERELTYQARLRLPDEISADERSGRIHEVAERLGLTARLNTRIDRLSDGERARAGTAVELITAPEVLLLDESDPGPDPDLDRAEMRQLRRLTDDGRTIVVATSRLEHLSICDVVMVLAPGGRVAYLGPPDGVFTHFRARDWGEVFATVRETSPGRLASDFRRRPDRDPRSSPPTREDGPSGKAVPAELPTPRSRPSCRGQMRTLIRRQLSVLAADRVRAGLLVLLPVGIGLIARGVPSDVGPDHGQGDTGVIPVLLLLVVGAALTGALLAVRELVRERGIVLRERAIGVSWSAYLWSKVVVLSGVGMLQATVMTVLALIGRDPPDPVVVTSWWIWEIAFVVAAVAVVSVLIGLVISALIGTERPGTPLVALYVVGQFVGSGGLIPVVGFPGLEQLSWFMPARWAFAATAATVDLGLLHPELPADGHWNHTLSTWRGDMTMVLLVGALALVSVIVLIRGLDPRDPRNSSPTFWRRVRPEEDVDTGRRRLRDDVAGDDIVADGST